MRKPSPSRLCHLPPAWSCVGGSGNLVAVEPRESGKRYPACYALLSCQPMLSNYAISLFLPLLAPAPNLFFPARRPQRVFHSHRHHAKSLATFSPTSILLVRPPWHSKLAPSYSYRYEKGAALQVPILQYIRYSTECSFDVFPA